MTIQHAALLTLIGLQLRAYMQGIHSGFQLELCNVKVSGWLNLVKLESQSKTKIDEASTVTDKAAHLLAQDIFKCLQ